MLQRVRARPATLETTNEFATAKEAAAWPGTIKKKEGR